MNPQDNIITGDIEYFSTLFWTQPFQWNTNEEEGLPVKPAEEDEEW